MNLRIIAAIGLLYVAFYGLPDINLPILPSPAPSRPTVDEPSAELQRAVDDVATICADMDTFDRMVWMATWEDAARIVAGEDNEVEVTFENTMGLRLFASNVFDVAWRRLANASGKYRGLDAAVEKAFETAVGNDIQPWSADLQDTVVDLFQAMAWAGARGE